MLKKNGKNAVKLILGILLLICGCLYLVPFTREFIDLNIYFVSLSIWIVNMIMSLAFGEQEPEAIMISAFDTLIVPKEGDGAIEQPKTMDDIMQIKAEELGVV